MLAYNIAETKLRKFVVIIINCFIICVLYKLNGCLLLFFYSGIFSCEFSLSLLVLSYALSLSPFVFGQLVIMCPFLPHL